MSLQVREASGWGIIYILERFVLRLKQGDFHSLGMIVLQMYLLLGILLLAFMDPVLEFPRRRPWDENSHAVMREEMLPGQGDKQVRTTGQGRGKASNSIIQAKRS